MIHAVEIAPVILFKMDFKIGQRWISHSETQLGMGIVTDIGNRRVKILYPAASDSRIYAMDSAPLSRIVYGIGDTVTDSEDHSIVIDYIEENEGLFTYFGQTSGGSDWQIHELDLSSFVHFTTPLQRLFSGQLDKNKNFSLRIATLQHLHERQQSSVRGLMGPRTDLLPHQVYIANTVARRHAPRVLLADEVGLGKTIEAGMILHQQLQMGKASRVLILVPNSLVHQWLVEMLRKFNINFAIFDSERVTALSDEQYVNPFETEQRIICPASLIKDPVARNYLLSCQWDTVVVDEAHHLTWDQNQASPEYEFAQHLACHCKSLLLLTATPEQVGLKSHFARLHLLDPARFHNFEAFKQEQENLQALNRLIQKLLSMSDLDATEQAHLTQYLGNTESIDREEIIARLLDRHGTGRVLFRNSRSSVEGFCARGVSDYPLQDNKHFVVKPASLYPEADYADDSWLQTDPRVSWLIEKLKSLKPHKVLVICHHAATAAQLDHYLNLRIGIRSASFYEGLSILERDRAAAYFSEGSNPDALDTGQGAQVLICSEIGSEGRNFQFAHHLILFDLPLNPDLLEQRIGRLDRIGQQNDIEIHVPYIKSTAQEILFRWFHEGIDLFRTSCPAGYEIYQNHADELKQLLDHGSARDETSLNQLIEKTNIFTQQTIQQLRNGRDKLLELNSCNKIIAQSLIDEIRHYENPLKLSQYMESVFNQFGIDYEYHSDHSYILRPTEHMHENFPGLKEEGLTITFDRNKALSREDMEFFSWEHPMVSESMEMIRTSDFGNTAVAALSLERIPKGTFFVEVWFTVNVISERSFQLDQFLPLHPLRFLLDSNNRDYSDILTYQKLSKLCTSLPKKTALAIAEKTRNITQDIVDTAQDLADKKLHALAESANEAMRQHYNNERERLISLQKVNPSIRDEEIRYLEETRDISSTLIERAKYQLQAVRLIINQ